MNSHTEHNPKPQRRDCLIPIHLLHHNNAGGIRNIYHQCKIFFLSFSMPSHIRCYSYINVIIQNGNYDIRGFKLFKTFQASGMFIT